MTKNDNFRAPFWHRLFDCFKNLQKLRLHIKTNTFSMFFASKYFHLLIEMSVICRVFSKPFPETVFRGSWCRSIMQRSVWAPFPIFRGFQKRHWNHFGVQEVAKRGRQSLRITTFGGHDHIGNGKCVNIHEK